MRPNQDVGIGRNGNIYDANAAKISNGAPVERVVEEEIRLGRTVA